MEARSPDHVRLGLAIKRSRAALHISQEELAHRAGLDRTYMGGVERGERNPSYTNLLRVAAALEISLSSLIQDAEKMS